MIMMYWPSNLTIIRIFHLHATQIFLGRTEVHIPSQCFFIELTFYIYIMRRHSWFSVADDIKSADNSQVFPVPVDKPDLMKM